METEQQMKDTLQLHIDSLSEQLHALSRDIWTRPELGGEETFAHDRLLRFFSQEDRGWTVQSRYKLPTAFRATWGPAGGGGSGCEPVLNVGFLCEYDALPGIGHACGHNLIAEVGAAAAAGLRAAVEKHSQQLPVPVKVTVLGTPAEENTGGKIDLMETGAFDDLDLVFMAHPTQQDVSFLPGVALEVVSVKYHGKPSHAGAYPWEGVNALDAAVLAYNNISVLRQQMKPEWRLHGIITHGGEKPNIIPAYTELEFYLRTPLVKDLRDLKGKAEACFRAAAVATGCQVEIIYPSHAYSNILPNATLSSLYEKNGKALAIQFAEQPQNFSDTGPFSPTNVNVSKNWVKVFVRSQPGLSRPEGSQWAWIKMLSRNCKDTDVCTYSEMTLLHTGNRKLLPGSTDFGNVSFILPGIHPFFYIGTDAFNHTKEYTEAAGAEAAQLFTLRTAKTLAMTAVDVVCCPDLLRKVREDFGLAKLKQEK